MDQNLDMRKTPVVLGVLNVVFGSIVLVSTVWGLASLFMTDLIFGQFSSLTKMLPHAPGQPDVAEVYKATSAFIKQSRQWWVLIWVPKAALSGALVWIGWGLYRRVGAMRRWAVLWSLAALGCLACELTFQVEWYIPHNLAMMAEVTRNAPLAEMQQSMTRTFSYVGVVLSVLFNSAYPVVLLILMGRKSAARDLI